MLPTMRTRTPVPRWVGPRRVRRPQGDSMRDWMLARELAQPVRVELAEWLHPVAGHLAKLRVKQPRTTQLRPMAGWELRLGPTEPVRVEALLAQPGPPERRARSNWGLSFLRRALAVRPFFARKRCHGRRR